MSNIATASQMPNLQSPSEHSEDTSLQDAPCSGSYSSPSEGGTDVDTNIVLRVECLSKYLLKRFVLIQGCFRWALSVIWIAFAVLAFQRSFYLRQRERINLRLALSLSALFVVLSTLALASFTYRILKVSRSYQQWSRQRRRLTAITFIQLFALELAIVMFVASSAVATKRHCNSAGNFCKWSQFIQFTCWNTVVMSQLLMTHCTCIWTDAEGKPRRTLFMQVFPGFRRNRPKAALVLDAPWSVHLPKLIVWAAIEATIIIQLVVALQGYNYVANLELRECLTPEELCRGANLNKGAVIARCIILGLSAIWHFVLVYHSLRDMARMPFNSFRLGRILCRMDASQDLGIGSSFMPKIAFLLASLNTACPGCQPNYLLLAMCMSSTMLIGMASRLLQPMSQSTGDDVTMQSWLQRFAWTEQLVKSRVARRNALPKDKMLLSAEPMFCFETAVKMLYWSAFVYELDETLKTTTASEDKAMELYNLERIELIRDPVTNTKCLVAWSQRTIVISFRGTANKQNAMHDIQAWLVPHMPEDTASIGCGFGAAPAVHSGFSVSWQSKLKKAVCALLQTVVNHDDKTAARMHVLVTGHSLGGAMAVLAAYDIVDLCPWKSVQVYTVGAPRPGNKAFADKYDAKVPDTWHVINPKDPVPKVGKFGTLYARPGQRVLIDLTGDMQVRPTPLEMRLPSLNPFKQIINSLPLVSQIIARCTFMNSIKAHMLASYKNCFLHIVKLELKRPRFGDGLEGVLELINSVNLTDMLQAADEDIAVAQDLSQHDVPKAENNEEAEDVLANSALSRDQSYHV